jgi:dephospho-CoA kinase
MTDKNLKFLKVGLTGSIGSGKSEARKIFASIGAYTIDADLIARELTPPGEAAYEKIVAVWGKGILAADGTLDRKKLGDIVFSSGEETQKMNAILHPLIIHRENELAADFIAKSDGGIIVTEAALMIETGSWKRFDKIVLVCCPEAIRKSRIENSRNLDSGMFELISGSQMPEEEKRKYADYIIENDDSLDDLKMKTERIYYKLVNELKRKKA